MNQLITIPQPCHEDWNQMTQQEQGRHCNACCKTVIDFTGWEPQEILFYLNMNAGNKICGRFTTLQLEHPIPSAEEFVKEISVIPLSWMKRAAAIFLFAFMIGASSCNDRSTGEPASIATAVDDTVKTVVGDTVTIASPKTIDTPVEPGHITGTIDPIPAPPKCNNNVKGEIEMMGEVSVQPPEPLPVPPTPQVLQGEPYVRPVPPVSDTAVMGKVAMPHK